MLQISARGLEFSSAEACEQFQMIAFGLTCATCGQSHQECPWGEGNKRATFADVTSQESFSAAA